MKILHNIQNMPWCKDQWKYSTVSTDSTKLLTECANTTIDNDKEISEEEIIEKSNAFPIPFPIETVRLEQLIKRKPLDKLKKNITSTYPLIHERVLLLIANFLISKRKFGTNIEKQFYKHVSICELIDRILKKRAVSFVGPYDKYLLLSGDEGASGWEEIGTSEEKPPLVLENCLSYDEMKLSAMVYISGYTECINDGKRKNCGVVNEDIAEDEAIIVGLIGPRFHRHERMDFEDILVTEKQNTLENGYGEMTPSCYDMFKSSEKLDMIKRKQMWRQMWADFYQIENKTYGNIFSNINKDAQKASMEKHYQLSSLKYMNPIFDNEAYYRRISVIADSALLEADHRAKESSKSAFLNVIGCGLGVWMISGHQADLYVLTFLERISALLESRSLDHVSDVNFAYITTGPDVMEMFSNTEEKNETDTEKRSLFLENENHPNGGINVQMQKREPSSRLTGPHSGKLLVMTYPWDSNAHPGNEFWFGSLWTSGDPAAACSTQISELHNGHINPAVSACHTKVVGRYGLKPLSEYCLLLTTTKNEEE